MAFFAVTVAAARIASVRKRGIAKRRGGKRNEGGVERCERTEFVRIREDAMTENCYSAALLHLPRVGPLTGVSGSENAATNRVWRPSHCCLNPIRSC